MNDPRHRCNGQCGEELELVEELYEDIGVGAGEEELLPDPSAAELEYADEIDPSAAELELDPELFEGTPIVRAVEPALVAGKIAQGVRDPNELTNFVFFLRHPELPKVPLRAGQEALMQEWKTILAEVVRPMLARFAGGPSSSVDASTPNVPLGKIVCSVPGKPVFTYQFTQDDLVTAARFVVGEAGGKDDAASLGTLWAMINRYAFHGRGGKWGGSFAGLLRAYSQTLQPIAKYVSMKPFIAKCNATFDNAGCLFQPNSTEVYPGTNIRQGNLRSALQRQKVPWSALPEGARKVALRALTGGAPSNVGNAGHVAGTDVFFQRKHGRRPTFAEWQAFTRAFAKSKGYVWPENLPFDQFKVHALFVDSVAKAYPDGVVRIVPASGAQVPTPTPTQSPTQAPTSSGVYDGKTPAPGTTEKRRSFPNNPPMRNAPGSRSRAAYNAVIDQFAAGTNPRYAQKRNTAGKIVSTYCNIFAWDVTSAMGAEIPHWIDKQGNPVGFNKGNELNANATNKWLHQHGARFGWRKVTLDEAVARANAGYPVVASWANPGGIGHIAVIRPGNPHPIGGPWMAQAGAINASWIRMFGGGDTKGVWKRTTNVETWTHD